MAATDKFNDQSKPVSIENSLESLEIERGNLETWPVKSLPHGNRLSKQMIIPKPRFLQQLEAHLDKELNALGCPSKGPHDLRLQAHREVFEMLIQDFKTYKPLLSAIKNEYDLYITYLEELIKELLPLKTQLYFLNDENEKKFFEFKAKEREEDVKLQKECRQLKEKMAQMRSDQLSFQAEIKRLQEVQSKTYEDYLNATDGRKLLIADIAELKAKQKEEKQTEGADSSTNYEDPVILKMKLARTKEDLKAASSRIDQMLADYGDVVPRREYDMLNTSFMALESEAESLKNQYATQLGEHNTLMAMHKDMQEQRDKSMKDLARIKGTATPRPDWSCCAEVIDGGPEKWAEFSKGLSSDELVSMLCKQLEGVDVSVLTKESSAFKGAGLGPDVPRYLRTEGQVTNRRIGRQEMEEMITGFWEFRSMKMINEGGEESLMDEILYEYLLKKNDGNENKAIEDGYNLDECCSKFRHLTHIDVFTKTLSGSISEEVYNNWISIQVSFMEKMKEASIESQETVSIPQLEVCIREVLPHKEEQLIRTLLQCAMSTAKNGDNIDIIKLMDRGPIKEPSQFVMILLEQNREESIKYASEVSKLLEPNETVSAGELSKVIKDYDPHKQDSDIQTLVARVFQIATEPSSDVTLSMKDMRKRLESIVVFKST